MFLAPRWGWNFPFYLVVGIGMIVLALIIFYLKPVNEHLKLKKHQSAFTHLWNTLVQPTYYKAFLATVLLATGGFMLMPYGSTFSQFNLGIDVKLLWVLYLVTGIFSMGMGPLLGKLSDSWGKYPVFVEEHDERGYLSETSLHTYTITQTSTFIERFGAEKLRK